LVSIEKEKGSIQILSFFKRIVTSLVIVRYGKLFRGLKVRIAQEFGAIGVIIYSDPQDDGYVRGPVFPEGPWRPPGSVQRGSTQFLSICPGDPRTEECGGNVTDHVPSIPVQPIGYGDAAHLLRHIGGATAPASFQGGLNFTYTIGGTGNSVTLKIVANWTTTTIWNVCTTVPGADNSSYVLLGNHRDAWTFGATDPNSGSSVLLEVVRAFGELVRAGFVPQRSIKICSWDGEEYGLLGSTSYAMQNKQDLKDNCVAYINTDVAVAGTYLVAGATPSVCSVVQNVLSKIVDPSSGKNLSALYPFKPWPQGEVKALGSGSDYTSFLHHLGIASIDWGFKDRDAIAPYHSAYDDLYWENHFGAANRTYAYFVVLAQMIGSTAIELAESSQQLNMTLTHQALVDYFNVLQAQMNNSTTVSIDLSALKMAIQAFGEAVMTGNYTAQETFMVERQFLYAPGLPKRQFYRNLIQAPGINLGYGSLVFPGPTQGIIDGDAVVAQQQTDNLASVITNAAKFLQ
jgi:N-acetylated-alpha-linked acidic dipeptidase